MEPRDEPLDMLRSGRSRSDFLENRCGALQSKHELGTQTQLNGVDTQRIHGRSACTLALSDGSPKAYARCHDAG